MENEQCNLGNHNYGQRTCEYCGKSVPLPVELAAVQYNENRENAEVNQITEIAFRVYGGESHISRVDAATDALEAYTEFFSEVENTVVSVDSYECKQRFTDSGTPYVEFTYGNFQTSF